MERERASEQERMFRVRAGESESEGERVKEKYW